MSDKITNAYEKTIWVNKETKLNADNMNKIEQGIYDALAEAESATGRLNELDATTLPALNEQIDSAKTELNQTITSKENELRQAISTGNETTLTNAKEYTDTTVTTKAQEISSAHSADMTRVNQSLTSLDTKISTETSAREAAITSLEQNVKNHSDTNLATAKSYTDTQLNSVSSQIKKDYESYSDTNLNTSKTYTDTKVKSVEDKIVVILKDAPEAYDTLKEISDYISSDKTGASNMLASINKNAEDITSLKDNKLGKEEQAKDSLKLNGKEASHYLDYNNFNNKPTIPSKVSDLTNDADYVASSKLATLNGASLINGGNITTKDISVNEIKQLFSKGQGGKGLSTKYNFDLVEGTNTVTQRSCAYGNGYIVMAGQSGKIQYSSDYGLTWETLPTIGTGTLTGLAYGNGIFVLVEYESKRIWTTDIPTNEWKNVHTFTEYSLENVRYINNEFVAVGTGGLIAKSNDGTNWQVVHTGENTIIDITYGNGKYVAVGAKGTILTSINSLIWYEQSIQEYTMDIRCITYANGTFVIGTQGGRIDWSNDGETWTQANNPNEYNIRFIRNFAYGDNRLYTCMYSSADGKGQVWLSNDKGKTWEVALTTDKYLWTICFANDRFIVGGNSGYLYHLDLDIKWEETNPNGEVTYFKNIVIQNDGSRTESDIYEQASVLGLRTFRITAPQSEWFRIAKVKDINTSSSGIFTFNIYGINLKTGNREVLSSDIFSVAYSWKEDDYISDVLNLAHSQTDDAIGGSSGSNTVTFGTGLTAIRLERYKNEVYVCGLFAISSVEDYATLDIDMLIENNINYTYLDNFEIIYFDNEYQKEYSLLEGTVLEPNTNYAIKLRCTYTDFLTAVHSYNSFLLQALDTTGDMGHKTFFELAYTTKESGEPIWKLMTCSPKIPIDEQGYKKYKEYNDITGVFFADFKDTTEEYYIDLKAKDLYGSENKIVPNNLQNLFWGKLFGTSFKNPLDNDYFIPRYKLLSFTIKYNPENSSNDSYKATIYRNGTKHGVVSPTEELILFVSEEDIISIIEENSQGDSLLVYINLDFSILEIEMPYKENIPLYIDSLTTIGNDTYNCSLIYQEYFPHEISKSYLMASVYRNLIDINSHLPNEINYLSGRVYNLEKYKLEYWETTASFEFTSEFDNSHIKEMLVEAYNKFCYRQYAMTKSILISFISPNSSTAVINVLFTFKRYQPSYYYSTCITLTLLNTLEVYFTRLDNIHFSKEITIKDVSYTNPYSLTKKQDTLVSGTNIKTINNQSILGSGNIEVLAKNKTTYSTPIVYARGAEGTSEDRVVQYSPNAYGQFLIQRDSNGMFFINEPTQSNHPASKNYIDTQLTAEVLINNIGKASSALDGIMSKEDKVNLDTLVNLLTEDDDDDVVNKINEILAIFNKYPEGSDLVSALALKANKDEVVDIASNQEINGIKTFNERPLVKVTGAKLPDTYQEVEYIESTGTQYINTGFIPTSYENVVAEVEYLYTVIPGAPSPYAYVMGVRGSATDRFDLVGMDIATQYTRIGTVRSAPTGITIETYVKYTQIVDVKSHTLIINGTTYAMSYESPTTVQSPLRLFSTSQNDGSGSQWNMSGRIWYCRLYDNGVLVRDLIPCYRKSDNVIGMYDTVSGGFFTNVGTGTFLKGEDVSVSNEEKNASVATLGDFKTINGESIVGTGDIVIQGESGGETRPLKEYVQAGVTEKQLEPNKYYIFDSQVASDITLTLAEEDETYLDEFMGEIKVDESPINVTFPNIIRWNDNGSVTNTDGVLTLEAKNTYLFSVANSLGLITNIPNPSLAEAVYTISGSVISWEEVANATSYDVYNGEVLLVENTTLTSIDMSAYLTDVGEYTIKVISKSNYYVDSTTIIAYYITAPLSAPTNLVLADTGTLSWDAVENAESYKVYEAEGGTLLKTVTVNYIDLTTITTLTGTYTIKVKAINTTSPNVYTDSELSEGVSYTWG